MGGTYIYDGCVTRYWYALFFAVMAGGVTAGITGVCIDLFTGIDPTWAPVASGVAGLALAALTFTAILRASGRNRDA